MRTFTQKPKTTQQTTPAKSTMPGRKHFEQSNAVSSILHLQRTFGNQAARRLLQAKTEDLEASSVSSSSTGFAYDFSRIPIHTNAHTRKNIKPKLKVNIPGDIYEQEADRVADQVLRQESPQEAQTQYVAIQAKAVSGDRDISDDLANRINRSKDSGSPLAAATRSFLEPRMQHDLSQVRIHTGTEAARMNQQLGARAFTHRQDIYFGKNQYKPHSAAGKRLLAHELTHTIQQQTSPIAKQQIIQRSAFETAREQNQTANPINVAVQAIRANYSGIGATWLSTQLVSGVIYAEGLINTDWTDTLGDLVGSSGSVGAGQLDSGAIQQVDTSIPSAAHQQFENQFGAAPSTWREKAEHDQWAFFYAAGYLAWSMTRAATLFQAVDGAASHIPLGFAMYQGAFNSIRNVRRRIARDKGIANTDVTWEMVEEAAGRGSSLRISPRERRVFNYAQLGMGSFDFEFQINTELESRSFSVPEGHVKVHSIANYTDSSVTPGAGDSYYIQLLELRPTTSYAGPGVEVDTVDLVRHSRVRFEIGQRQVYEWTGLRNDSTYAVNFTNENSNEISGSGKVEYLY